MAKQGEHTVERTPVVRGDSAIWCPVCDCEAGAYFIQVDSFQIFKCANCGLEYTHPNPTDEELTAFYQTYSDIRARNDVVIKNAQAQLDILKELGLKNDGRILDYGSGGGEFVGIAGENCFGIELNTRDTQRVFRNTESLPIKKFDFLTLWGVLEHLNTPLDTIRSLSSLLNDDGKIAITTVNAEGIIPYYYKPIEHLTYWTRTAFEKLFHVAGLRIVSYSTYTMIQSREVYVDRLLSRTPEMYREAFSRSIEGLPTYLSVPTNEVLVVGVRSTQ